MGPSRKALMPRELFFPLRPAIALAEHALAATDHAPLFGQHDAGITNPPPALHWAKDDGTYLLSNGRPRPEGVLYARTADGLELGAVDPAADPDRWALVRAETERICGGDDFVEGFDLDTDDRLLDALRTALRDGFTHLVLVVSDDTVDLAFDRRPDLA